MSHDNRAIDVETEEVRSAALREAQLKATELYQAFLDTGIIRAGALESDINAALHRLARDMFGIRRYWHKRLVRSGPNTMAPYMENPPDRALDVADILIVDFGPIFGEWEADIGRTIVIGDEPGRKVLADDVQRIWNAGKNHFDGHPDITGAELYDAILNDITSAGWTHGVGFVGHLVGEFPHENLHFPGENASSEHWLSYIAPGNREPLRRLDSRGRQCHWILEVFAAHPDGQYAAFREQLLDL